MNLKMWLGRKLSFKVIPLLCFIALMGVLNTSCKKQLVKDPNELLNKSCGDSDTLVVYQIIYYGDTDTLFFHAATSDISVIQKADEELSKPIEERLKHINGLLGSGECDYNPNYDWHFVPNEWDLVEASIEWCDGFPANPDSTNIDWSCPWPSRVAERF